MSQIDAIYRHGVPVSHAAERERVCVCGLAREYNAGMARILGGLIFGIIGGVIGYAGLWAGLRLFQAIFSGARARVYVVDSVVFLVLEYSVPVMGIIIGTMIGSGLMKRKPKQ